VTSANTKKEADEDPGGEVWCIVDGVVLHKRGSAVHGNVIHGGDDTGVGGHNDRVNVLWLDVTIIDEECVEWDRLVDGARLVPYSLWGART
jgi:hypothetical protein